MKTLKKTLLITLFLISLSYSCKENQDENLQPLIILNGEFEQFQVIDESNLELSSTIIFDASNRWQLVASSQNYGTNYAVYGQFVLDSVRSNEKEVFLNTINLKILNYKSSPVELGLENFEISQNEDNGEVKIEIHLKGLSPKRVLSKTYEEPVKVLNNSIVTSERYLEPIFEISSEMEINNPKIPKYEYLAISDTLYFKPFGYFYTAFENGYPKDSITVFDSEFFYKDGIYVLAKPNFDAQIEEIIGSKMAPGFRCKTAKFVGKIQLGS